MNWVHYDKSKLVEPARAVRVWRAIRLCSDELRDPKESDFDQMVIDAANAYETGQVENDRPAGR